MKIKEITRESGNDFSAIFECEHCGALENRTSGYHDNFYHTQVIPNLVCDKCKKKRFSEVPEVVERI